MKLLQQLRPRYWFSGHMHVKFSAVYPHNTTTNISSSHTSSSSHTRFLALDKPMPRRDFLQVLDIPLSNPALANVPKQFAFDEEWISILRQSHSSLPTNIHYTPTTFPSLHISDIEETRQRLMTYRTITANTVSSSSTEQTITSSTSSSSSSTPSLSPSTLLTSYRSDPILIPYNFMITVPPYEPTNPMDKGLYIPMDKPYQLGNPQMDELLLRLNLHHKTTIPTIGAEQWLENIKTQLQQLFPNNNQPSHHHILTNNTVSLPKDNTVSLSSTTTDVTQSKIQDPAEIDLDNI